MADLVIGHERVHLALRAADGSTWRAELSLPSLRAFTDVSLSPPEVELPLSSLFDDLARGWAGSEWRGCSGTKRWTTCEGGLALAAVADRLGHVTLTVELRERSGSGWLVRGDVPLDAGQLDSLADDVRGFVGPHGPMSS